MLMTVASCLEMEEPGNTDGQYGINGEEGRRATEETD